MAVNWSYYDKAEFSRVNDKYLPLEGQGETMATQITTAVNKLVYKWYNDGDVFDNTGLLDGWCNDLSSYANWLYENTDEGKILVRVYDCWNDSQYEDLLKELADSLLDDEKMDEWNKKSAVGDIYTCEGQFHFVEYDDEEEEEW